MNLTESEEMWSAQFRVKPFFKGLAGLGNAGSIEVAAPIAARTRRLKADTREPCRGLGQSPMRVSADTQNFLDTQLRILSYSLNSEADSQPFYEK